MIKKTFLTSLMLSTSLVSSTLKADANLVSDAIFEHWEKSKPPFNTVFARQSIWMADELFVHSIAKAGKSGLRVTLSSEITRALFSLDTVKESFSQSIQLQGKGFLGQGPIAGFSGGSAGDLFLYQTISAYYRSKITDLKINTLSTCSAHALIQGGRNFFRGKNLLSGAIDGGGYCITNEISKNYKENGKNTFKSLTINIAGAYATEIIENIPYCIAAPFACKVFIAKGFATGTVVSAMQVYDYFMQA